VKKYWRLLGSGALVGLLIWRIDWRQVASAFARMDATYWFLAFGLFLLTQAVSTLRWQLLGQSLGLGGRWRDYLAHYFVGMFFNLVLPTSVGGDVVRAWYLGRQQGAKPAAGRQTTAFLSVLADRVNGFAVLIGVACAAALFCPIPMPSWIAWIVAGLGAACLLGFAALPLLPRVRAWLPQHQQLTRIFDAAEVCLRDRRTLLWISLLSVLVQIGGIVLAWLIGVGMGLPIPPLYYGVMMPLVAILTLLPVSLNGMGLREFGTVALLVPLHIEAASAVTLSLLIFAVYTTASLLGGLVYLFGHLSPFSALRDPPSSEAESAGREAANGKEASGHADSVGGDSDQGRKRESQAVARTAAPRPRSVECGGSPSRSFGQL
jgi:uncharacterized membrane protein YbhN (UPF0104 family)